MSPPTPRPPCPPGPGAAARGLSLAVLLALGALLPTACAGRDGAAPPAEVPQELLPLQDEVRLSPGATGDVTFVLRATDGAAVPGQTVGFALVDEVEMGGPGGATPAGGARLESDTAVTDGAGRATARVTAGASMAVFRVRAVVGDVETEAVVVVVAGNVGSVDVAPFFPPGSRAAASATTIEVLFFDDSSCGALSPRRPPPPTRPLRRLPTTGEVTRFDIVNMASAHAVVGRARDGHGSLLAFGCADLPGSALIDGAAVRLGLPLADGSPDPVGRFAVTSRFAPWPRPAAAAALAGPWRDLGDCPLDPAQQWLDCTIDALGTTTAADPLDCVPGGGEDALAVAITARRGTFLAGADGATTACRAARDATGGVSIDALALGLFGSPKPPVLVALPDIAADAERLLDTLTIRSRLDVRPSVTAGVYQVTHDLVDVVFGTQGVLKEVGLQPLGLPVLQALTTATAHDDRLVIAPHGLTLRLGTAARVAFGALALARRGLPGTAPELLAMMTGLATAANGTLSGCAALDDAVCAPVGRSAGCLMAACTAGLAALGERLEASFEAANGLGLDLGLSGEAPLLDPHGNGSADRLGDLEAAAPQPGTWRADLRMTGGRAQASGLWEAVRTGN